MRKWMWLLLLMPAIAWASDVDLPKVINEGSHSYVTLSFTDETGDAEEPRDILLWVNDDDTNERLHGTFFCCSTDAGGTCASSGCPLDTDYSTPIVTLLLAPEATEIVDTTKDLEKHVIFVTFRYPVGCDPTPGATPCYYGTGRARFQTRNLPGVELGGPATYPTPVP